MFGALAGVLSLIVLDVVLTPTGSKNAAGILGFFGGAIAWIISPTVPGIPNLAGAKKTSTTTTT
jgi:hypothetical protein